MGIVLCRFLRLPRYVITMDRMESASHQGLNQSCKHDNNVKQCSRVFVESKDRGSRINVKIHT